MTMPDSINPFTNAVPTSSDAPDNEPLKLLGQLAEALKSQTFSGISNIRIVIVPGHSVNMGQQYKFCVQILEDTERHVVAYTDILFRAYVPFNGYPTVVDLMGEGHRSCSDKDSLLVALSELIANPDLRVRLSSLATLAQDQLL